MHAVLSVVVSGGPGPLGWTQSIGLVAILLWLGLLTLVVLVARRPWVGARRLTMLAFLLALVAGLSFVFWPITVAYSSSTRATFDVATQLVTRTDSENVQLVLFPSLRQLGVKAVVIGAIPVLLTGLALAWQRARLPAARVARIASLVGLAGWFTLGTVSGVSWWAVPGAVAMLAAVGREEGAE